MPEGSKIFSGYRALGYVSNHVPLAVRYHQKHKENYVITCVGKSFHTYNCSKLGIVSVSDSHPDNISCIAVDGKHVYTGCGNVIRAFVRGRQVAHIYEGHTKDIEILLPFGDHLISVDKGNNVKVWDIESEGVYLEMNFSDDLSISVLMHPSTYLNKILIGSKQGLMQLWNIRKDKMLYLFPGWGAPITVIEQAPAVDVVAVGLSDGQIIVHNLKFDETIMKFTQDWGPVSSITFRTDGHPVMVTGSSVGHIALWDLENKKLQCQMRDSHSTAVSGMMCLASEPLMVTSAADNTLKVWIFDLPDGGGRLLRQRTGHSAPPNRVRHYGNNGKNVITAGQDSTLRSFSVLHDKHNKSLGRASYNKAQTKKSGLKNDQHMMPPVTHFAAEPCKESDWDNIIACHRGLRTTTTWSYHRSTMGHHRLENDRFKKNEQEFRTTVAEAADISPCGNFVVIGYSSGHVDKFNIQSGLHRGSYGNPIAHDCGVRGVSIDGLDQVLVTVDASGKIKFWNFKQKGLLDTLDIDSQVSSVYLHRESSMLAVSLDDFTVCVVDVDTRRVVRKFTGHTNSVTDMGFSPDARWLLTSSMDCTVRVWDMPTGRMIDCFAVDSAVSSLSMSPSGDFLTTVHVDDLGVYLWSNVTLFSHVPLRPLPHDYQPQIMELPSTKHQAQDEEVKEEVEDYNEMMDFKSPEQLSNELVTLSLIPNSRWLNLLNLQQIKRRNKPKQPPKTYKSAPFFLPTVSGLELKFDLEENKESEEYSSKIFDIGLLPMTELGRFLSEEKFDKALERLKGLGPISIDSEIRSLSVEGGGSITLMSAFLEFISHTFKSRKNFELANAYLGLFLQLHGQAIGKEPVLAKRLEALQAEHSEVWKRIQDLFSQNLCLVNYLRSAAL